MNEVFLVIICETLDVVLILRGFPLFLYDLLQDLEPRGGFFPLENELFLIILTFEAKFVNTGFCSLFAEIAEIEEMKIQNYLSPRNFLSLINTENAVLICTIYLLVGIENGFGFLKQVTLLLLSSSVLLAK